jgi:hypothetical protein
MSDPKFWACCHPWPLLVVKHKVNIIVNLKHMKIVRHRRGRVLRAPVHWVVPPSALEGPVALHSHEILKLKGAPKLASLASEVKSWMWNFQSCTFSYSMERCPNIHSLNMGGFLLLEVVIISLPLSRSMSKISLIFMIFIREYKVPSKYTSKISPSALWWTGDC